MESFFLGFYFLFYFPFKNKNKISGDSDSSKTNFSPIKMSLAIESTHVKNVGPQNGDFVRECLEGQT